MKNQKTKSRSESNKSTAIAVSNLTKSFGKPPTHVLRGLDFKINQGEFVAVTGRSGSGKSTLLYTVSGLDTPTSGTVELLGTNIHSATPGQSEALLNRKIGFVFQFHYLLPELTALENVLMPARKSKMEQQKAPYAHELFERFALTYCEGKLPSQMSGGEQQRVAIVRALIMQPQILFADEPTGNLDSTNGEIVLDIFKEANQNGTTILMVTHDDDYAALAGRQIHLIDGRIDRDFLQKR